MRAPILRRYLDLAPGRALTFRSTAAAPLEQFEQIAGQYPVFRIGGE
jgi:hypothetical protein